MKSTLRHLNLKRLFALGSVLSLMIPFSSLKAEKILFKTDLETQQNEPIISAKKINATTIELSLADNHHMLIDFYGDNIFRAFQDISGGMMRDPESKPEAKILVDTARRPVPTLNLHDENGFITIFISVCSLGSILDIRSVTPVSWSSKVNFLCVFPSSNAPFTI